jgi:hypothetical protein
MMRIIDALRSHHPMVTVGIRADGEHYRASLVGFVANGKAYEAPCRPSPPEAVEALYERVLEEAWKDFRPAQLKLSRLGLTVPEPSGPSSQATRPDRADDA